MCLSQSQESGLKCLLNEWWEYYETKWIFYFSYFFLVNLSSVFLKFLLSDGVFFQGKVVPEHFIPSISSEYCLEIR